MVHGLSSHATLQIRIHHLSDDRSGTNDGDLHHDVVKTFWLQARQARHLRPALDLKHANRVCLLQSRIHRGIIRRQVGEIYFFTSDDPE